MNRELGNRESEKGLTGQWKWRVETGERPRVGGACARAEGAGRTESAAREGKGRGRTAGFCGCCAPPGLLPDGRQVGGEAVGRPVESLNRRFPRDSPVVPLRPALTLCCNPEAKSRVRAAGCRGSQVCGGCLLSLDGERRCLRRLESLPTKPRCSERVPGDRA